jgi:hypothetical protein
VLIMKREQQLISDVGARAKEIHADAYPMSIGEIISLYKENELDIHPEFQRFFRWSPMQKSKFIESILLGIPIPSIFVSQRNDGVWDVIDGTQRLSTIFEFVGILRDREGNLIPPSKLVGTEYLPTLEGMAWENRDDPEQSFPNELRLDFKRQKLDLKIIKRESDENAKYDLFERLNTLGSKLSDQEVRNCLLVMINPEMHEWIEKLTASSPFQKTIAITERLLLERYDMELSLRFLIFTRADNSDLTGIKDLDTFITKKMRAIATDPDFETDFEETVFRKTFRTLYKALGQQCFVRKGVGRGGFLISVYEVIAMGLGWRIRQDMSSKIDLHKIRDVVNRLENNKDFKEFSKSGRSASSRIPRLIPLGRAMFQKL